MVQVLCCVCGISIAPNAANTCSSCLATNSDITRGISTEVQLHQCKGCKRWHRGAGKWMLATLESRELMALCLANINGLNNKHKKDQTARLVDASWIWTEPHSMRLKTRLTIQKEVQLGTILQQSFVVEFLVRNQQCSDCASEFRQGAWKSLVQVRQRVGHKRTFLYLEQLILKHDAHRGALSIEAFRDGMDFYFPDKSKAARFQCFLDSVVPTKTKVSKKLIGTDDKSNIANFKYTSLVEICPLCKDDVLFLPAKLARQLGNISQLVLVKNISNVIHFIDPLSGQVATLNADQYWRDALNLRPILTAKRTRMTRFVVLNKEPIFLRRNVSQRATAKKQKARLAELTLAKEDDLGQNNQQHVERSHVGYLMQAGDVCAGYDLEHAQLIQNDSIDDAQDLQVEGKLPRVIILRKLYGGVADADQKKSSRKWALKRLPVAAGDEGASMKARRAKEQQEMDDQDEEDFMQEVEADKEMRQNMNLYKAAPVVKKVRDAVMEEAEDDDDEEEDDEDDDQKVRLDELLDGLALDAGPDKDMEDSGAVGAAGAGAAGDDKEGVQFQQYYDEGEKAAKDGIKYVNREDARAIKNKDAAVPVTAATQELKFDVNDPDPDL